MQSQLPLYPPEASNFASKVDSLMLFMVIVCVFFAVGICIAVVYFFFKYRRRDKEEVGAPIHGNMKLEVTWIVIPFFLLMAMFAWGTEVFVKYRNPPQDSLDIYVVGKQWMWKLQQPNGRREINELHVPVNRDVRLILSSEDVIHDFSIPAFRIKMDDVPGRYNTLWFRATKVGRYHFFCSQYCGTNHALMGGWVTVMKPADYAAWLAGSTGTGDPVAEGQKLYEQLGCSTCHLLDGTGRGPSYDGLYGSKVRLADGRTVTADDTYLRGHILTPPAYLVARYQPIMPSFQGLVTEEQILDLIAYIKSLQNVSPPDNSAFGGLAAEKK